jgi:hypothetical protein
LDGGLAEQRAAGARKEVDAGRSARGGAAFGEAATGLVEGAQECEAAPVNELLTRPSLLRAVDTPTAWGWELWLTSTRSEGAALLPRVRSSLAELVLAHPEVLGTWARSILGDEMPIFAKLIHTHFPARVHIGFRRPVERGELLAAFDREQGMMRRLYQALRIPDGAAFAAYQERYSAWATAQALEAWRREDDGPATTTLAPFVDGSFALADWLRDVRANRAAIVDTLNDVDLRQERGNLFLSSAGTVHAIFGLSHQTHPLDHSRAALEALYATLADRSAAGATDADLAKVIDEATLPRLRAENREPPKNEAWFPTVLDGLDVLAEPQQSSDTTYSLADFYTPFTWGGGRARFRKGAPDGGLSRDDLSGYLAGVDCTPTPLASIRREPREVAGVAREGAKVFCLVDEPTRWPFFTAYQVELNGDITLRPPPGVFQQLVVTRGRVALTDEEGAIGELSSRAPGFVPATLKGSYGLTAREPATVLVYAVPGARGGSPVVL